MRNGFRWMAMGLMAGLTAAVAFDGLREGSQRGSDHGSGASCRF